MYGIIYFLHSYTFNILIIIKLLEILLNHYTFLKDIFKLINKIIFKILFHAQYTMPYILIQLNEGIIKLVTLMVKGDEIITKMKVLQLHFKT